MESFTIKQRIGIFCGFYGMTTKGAADEIGVHKNTISKVLNDNPVGRETIKTINKHIASKGFYFYDDGFITTPTIIGKKCDLMEIKTSMIRNARRLQHSIDNQ